MRMDFLKEELQGLQSLGLYRSLKTVESPQGSAITLGGRRVLNFSSNDYLGLANDTRLKEAALRS